MCDFRTDCVYFFIVQDQTNFNAGCDGEPEVKLEQFSVELCRLPWPVRSSVRVKFWSGPVIFQSFG